MAVVVVDGTPDPQADIAADIAVATVVTTKNLHNKTGVDVIA